MDDDKQSEEYAQQAHYLVDNVIETALKKLQDEYGTTVFREKTDSSSVKFALSRDDTQIIYKEPEYEHYNVQNISWLNIADFSTEKAEQKIHEFIKTWDYEDSWLYCVDFLGEDQHQYDTRYRFRVRWSIPTRRKPIPRATASIYFTFEVSKIKPKNYPVDVYYVFETNQLIHRPGESRFREKWLKDIIESKIIMMEAIVLI